MVLLQFKSGLQTCAVNRFLCGGWTTQVKRYSTLYCNPENSLVGGRTGIFSPEYWSNHASCKNCGTRQKSKSAQGCETSRAFHSSPGTSFRVGSTHFDKETFYDKLEIHPQSTSREVKEAFYKLSKLYHPDTNADNVEALKKFQSMSEAYEVLSNPAQRAKYDKGVLGRSSSVAEREQASHSFDKEVFYGARSGREGKPGGSKDLDQYVSNSRTISFRRKQEFKKKVSTGTSSGGVRRTMNQSAHANAKLDSGIFNVLAMGFVFIGFFIFLLR